MKPIGRWSGPLCAALFALLSAPAAAQEGDTGETEQRLEELDERLFAVEDDIDQILGWQDRLLSRLEAMRLNWSGAYRATVNNFHLVDRSAETRVSHLELVVDDLGQPQIDPLSGAPQTVPVSQTHRRDTDDWYDSSWVNRLRLTMSFDVTDRLRFYGRLAAFKYFNELKAHPVTLDMHSTRYPRDNTIRVERAYFDWFITDWLVFTAGRVAAPEGPPAELKENSERSATWGVQMVEAELETLMMTIHLSPLLQGTYLRVFYVPFTNHADFTLYDDLTLFADDGIDPMHALGAMLEWSLPFLGSNLGQLGLVYVPYFRPRSISLEVPGLPAAIPPQTASQDSLGSYAMASGLIEVKDFFGSGFDLFAAYALTSLSPSTGRMVYEVPVSLDVQHPMTGETVDQYSGTQPYEIGLASYEEEGEGPNLGHMFYVGTRYTPHYLLGAYAPRVGVEVNRGTRYHVAWATPSDLLVNKLATKGWAAEAYLIQPCVPDHLFIRLGYLHVIKEYQGLYIGPTGAVDQTIQNIYGLIEAHW